MRPLRNPLRPLRLKIIKHHGKAIFKVQVVVQWESCHYLCITSKFFASWK